MFKKIMREISLSNKRNPVKIVLIGLILLISSNLVFAGLSLHHELSEAERLMTRHARRILTIKYKDPSIVDPREKVFDEEFPLMYQKDIPILEDERITGGIGSSGAPYLTTLLDYHPSFDERKYEGKSIASLGLRKEAAHFEMVTDYGIKYLAWDYINHYKQDFSTFDDINIIEGRKFENMEDSVIIIPEAMAQETGLKVGDSVDFTYDRRPIDFKIVEIFTTDDKGLSEDVILAQGGEDRINETVISFGSKYSIDSTSEIYPYEKDADLYLELLNELLTSEYDNLMAINLVEKYTPFLKSLETAKMITLVFIIFVIVMSILALQKVIKNDIVAYQKDAFVSIYEDDKKVVKMSNYMQVIIVTIISIAISILTAPAVNKTIAKPLLIHKLDFVNEVYPDYDFDDFKDYATMYYGKEDDGMMQTMVPDIVVVARMDYMPQVRSIVYLSGLMLFVSTLGVFVGNKKLDRKE